MATFTVAVAIAVAVLWPTNLIINTITPHEIWCWAFLTITLFFSPSGANVIYKNVIQPIFNKHESDIDAALNSIDAKSVIEAALAAAQTATAKGKEN